MWAHRAVVVCVCQRHIAGALCTAPSEMPVGFAVRRFVISVRLIKEVIKTAVIKTQNFSKQCALARRASAAACAGPVWEPAARAPSASLQHSGRDTVSRCGHQCLALCSNLRHMPDAPNSLNPIDSYCSVCAAAAHRSMSSRKHRTAGASEAQPKAAAAAQVTPE